MIAEKDFAAKKALGSRKTQQDYHKFADLEGARGVLMVVADGMGGYKGGDCASSVAVEKFVAVVLGAQGPYAKRFQTGLLAANTAIDQAAQQNPEELEGMGTTLLAAAVLPSGLEWISVGDCALHLFHGGELKRLNEDHSMRAWFEQQVAEGALSREAAENNPFRNRLRSALVGAQIAMTDLSPKPFPLQEGDLIVAASDGLETLDRPSLLELLQGARGKEAHEIAAVLLDAVRDRDKPRQDNTTVSVVKVPAGWLHG